MQRLVTKEDKQKYHELNSKGVSVNQYYNFPDEPIEPVKKTFFQERKSIPIGEVPEPEVKNPVTERNEPSVVNEKKPQPEKEPVANKVPAKKVAAKKK